MNTTQPHNLPAPLLRLMEQLADAAGNLTKSKYTSVAGLTVLLYDIVLLLSDEVTLIWKRPRWSPSRFAYLINRYVPPVFLIIANYQLGGFRGQLTDNLRKLGRHVFNCPGPYGSVCDIYPRTTSVTVHAVVNEKLYYDRLAHVCNVKSTPKSFRFIFLAPIFFEIFIGVLTFWKCFQHAYVISHASAAPILHILLRDGLIWWVSIVGLRVWNALIVVLSPISMIYLGVYIQWALVSTLVSRLFLNVIKAVNGGSEDAFSSDYADVREKERAAARGGRSQTVINIQRQQDTFDFIDMDDEFDMTDLSSRCQGAHGHNLFPSPNATLHV
ncbi:hypothetical protein FRC14_003363 [Serendipita sp. 396]|nr:hypothetical protein FRC14_003363 [Serendipita sp. 396]KAG8788293.1 hypothetical protein FRC15_005173 [Serendipita sp. 397]KAG8874580.1 hypothetical protein FRC20_005703 [Serendipita sp. 405]